MLDMQVVIDLLRLRMWGRSIDDEIHNRSSGSLTTVFKKWAVRYRSFIQLRFDKASKGDGTWQPLSQRTIRTRRKRSSTVLRDKGLLFAALTPIWEAPPGSVNILIDGGVRVGYGGSEPHSGGMLTIAQIAQFHQDGNANLPKREIIVDPSQAVIDACALDLEKELENRPAN